MEAAVKSGIEIPKGVVEGLNVAMREDARSAANLNPQRFSEKQKIDVNSMVTQPQTMTIVNDLKEGSMAAAGRKIVLSEVVGKGYRDFWNSRMRYLVCKGSRGSKKSKTTALRLIVNLMSHPDANALVIRRYARSLRDSCFADLEWAIHRLGFGSDWRSTVSPLEIVQISTGQKILFRGLDDGQKVTSVTVAQGVLCWVWCEEASQLVISSISASAAKCRRVCGKRSS